LNLSISGRKPITAYYGHGNGILSSINVGISYPVELLLVSQHILCFLKLVEGTIVPVPKHDTMKTYGKWSKAPTISVIG
jgi:hypothetical protein